MSKIIIYTTSNSANIVARAGYNAGRSAIEEALFQGALSEPITILSNKDELKIANELLSNTIYLKTENGETITFIDVKIDVKKEKNIKETVLLNRKGSVKELIQEKDYIVKITGTLFGEGRNMFPHEELKLLNSILSNTKNITVASAYLNIFKIDKLVLKSADFNQSGWKYFNTFPFILNFASDDNYDFLVE